VRFLVASGLAQKMEAVWSKQSMNIFFLLRFALILFTSHIHKLTSLLHFSITLSSISIYHHFLSLKGCSDMVRKCLQKTKAESQEATVKPDKAIAAEKSKPSPRKRSSKDAAHNSLLGIDAPKQISKKSKPSLKDVAHNSLSGQKVQALAKKSKPRSPSPRQEAQARRREVEAIAAKNSNPSPISPSHRRKKSKPSPPMTTSSSSEFATGDLVWVEHGASSRKSHTWCRIVEVNGSCGKPTFTVVQVHDETERRRVVSDGSKFSRGKKRRREVSKDATNARPTKKAKKQPGKKVNEFVRQVRKEIKADLCEEFQAVLERTGVVHFLASANLTWHKALKNPLIGKYSCVHPVALWNMW
jgi:hypothetical protein